MQLWCSPKTEYIFYKSNQKRIKAPLKKQNIFGGRYVHFWCAFLFVFYLPIIILVSSLVGLGNRCSEVWIRLYVWQSQRLQSRSGLGLTPQPPLGWHLLVTGTWSRHGEILGMLCLRSGVLIPPHPCLVGSPSWSVSRIVTLRVLNE
jgi:hypothetical protein